MGNLWHQHQNYRRYRHIMGGVLSFFFIMGVANAADSQLEGKGLGWSQAPQGGQFQIALSSEPETLNPISSQDFYAQKVFEYVMEGLLKLDEDTYELKPGLAERYELSPNQKVYTFYLRKNAVFQDGHPVTAEDVKFSFDCVKNPAFKAAHRIPYYENISQVEVVDPHTVRITTNKKYFNNIMVMSLAGFTPILPQHVYGNPQQKMNKELVGSGPYKLEDYQRGKSLVLTKNPLWWGLKDPSRRGEFNFNKITIRFVKEENLALEMLKKNQIDSLDLTPEAFMKKTLQAPFGQTVMKKKVENSDPERGYSFVAWNLRNPLFKEKRVRVALAHLMNREEMNKKLRYDLSVLARGPWSFNSPFAHPEIKPILFNPQRAKELLAAEGWRDQNKDGVLEKMINGKSVDFRFSLMFANRDVEKYFTLYKEDLKKAGIEMDLKLLEWNTFVKAVDDKKFEAVSLAWSGGSIENDPKQIWHSESARAGGSNFISYSQPKVDKLIDAGREEMDPKKRTKIWHQIDQLIAEDAPYLFMFNERYSLYAHHKKIGMVKESYKYSVGRNYWWSGE